MRNGNYGGFFQAFALQEKLQELGHSVSIDSPVVFKQNARSFVKYLFYLLSGRWNSLLTDKVRNAINQNFIDFASVKLNLTPSSQKGLSCPAREANYFDGFVVGSDQVWRPSYCNVEEYMFASLPDMFIFSARINRFIFPVGYFSLFIGWAFHIVSRVG